MKLKLKTITPVHIGTGLTYGPSEYFTEQNKIKRIKLNAFLGKLDKKQIKELCKEMDEGNFSLNSFLDSHDINKSNIQILYKTNADFEIRKDIREQIKTNNIPYIPGTSIKGAIRTALLWYGTKDKDCFEKLKESVKGDNRKKFISNNFVEDFFRCDKNFKNDRKKKYDAKYDLLKFLEISDFMPEEKDKELNIKEIKTYSLKQYNGLVAKYSVFAETLSGNFTGTIKISPQLRIAIENKKEYSLLGKKLNILGLDETLKEHDLILHLKNILKQFNNWCLSNEMGLCEQSNATDKTNYLNQMKQNNQNNNLMRIGFGVGTIYQTLIKLIEEEDKDTFYQMIDNLQLHGSKKKKASLYGTNLRQIPYPKSIEFTADNKSLGWLEWE